MQLDVNVLAALLLLLLLLLLWLPCVGVLCLSFPYVCPEPVLAK
jgi:hypothetical protein